MLETNQSKGLRTTFKVTLQAGVYINTISITADGNFEKEKRGGKERFNEYSSIMYRIMSLWAVTHEDTIPGSDGLTGVE